MARDNFTQDAYTEDYFAQYDSTITNGEARIPICFCIDTSESMRFVTNRREELLYIENTSSTVDGIANVVEVKALPGVTLHYRIEEVKRVILQMIDRIKYDTRLANAAVVSIITFDEYADCIVEFSDVSRISEKMIGGIRTGRDITNASRGIRMSLERLDQFRRLNSSAGNESYKPVLVFISDGKVNNDPNALVVGNEVRERSENGNLNVIPIGIGNDIDETWMRRLSKESHVYHMEHEDEFDKVFEIITSRIARTTMVLSVDEHISEDGQDIEVEEDVTNMQYGQETSAEDIYDFLNEFMNKE